MLLNILNLPHDVRIGHLRKLILDTCGIDNVILDNLVNHGNGKRITVGLVDNVQASLVMAKLNGYFHDGRQLRVEVIHKQGTPQQQQPPKRSYYEAPPAMPQTQPFQSNPVMYPTAAPPQAQPAYNSMPFYLAPVQAPYGSDGVMPVQYPQYGKQNNLNAWDVPLGYQSQGFQQDANSRASIRNPPSSTIVDKNNANQQNIAQNRGYVTYSSNDYGSYVDKREEKNDRNEANYGGHGSNYGRAQGRNQRGYESPNRSRSPHGRGRYDGPPSDRYDGPRSDRYDGPPSDRYDNRDSDRYGNHDREDSRDCHDSRDRHDNRDRDRQGNYERNYNRYDSNDRNRNDNRERDGFNNYERNSYDNQRHNYNRQENRNSGDRNRFENRFSGRDRLSGNTSNNSAKPFGNKPAMDYGNKHESKTFYNKTNFKQNKGQPQKPNFQKPPGGPNTIQNRKELRTITFVSSQAVVDEILRKVPERPSSPLFRELKSQVVTRVRTIVQQTKCNNVVKIQELYRQQYPDSDDAVLLESVLGARIAPIQQPTGGNFNAGPRHKFKRNPPASTSVQQADPPQGRLPKYINQDKKAYQQLRREQKQEAQSDFVPQVDPKYDSAVEEEFNALKKVFIEACPPNDDKMVERIRKDIVTIGVEKFLKVMKTQLSKRLSGNFLGCVRIFFFHKPPPRDSLDQFLKSYGVVSLKKSDRGKFFVATCNTADGYDNLIAVGRTEIDGFSINMKPFQICGKPIKSIGREKGKKKKKGANFAPMDLEVSNNDWSCEPDLEEMDIKQEPKNEEKPIIEETLVKPDANIAKQPPIDEKPINNKTAAAVIPDANIAKQPPIDEKPINNKTAAASDMKPLKDEKPIIEPIVASAIDDGDLEDF